MTLFEAYDAILALGASAAHADRTREMRAGFEQRTGEFAPEDSWFEARSRAFWDDAVTTQGFARDVAGELPERARPWAARLATAHRGLFVRVSASDADETILKDLWGGAEFVLHNIDPSNRDALAAAAAPFDARLVGSDEPAQVSMLPGALFHPADAAAPIAAVIAKGREAGMQGAAVLDALLKMERGLRASARVKATYAYRADRLVAPAAPAAPAGKG